MKLLQAVIVFVFLLGLFLGANPAMAEEGDLEIELNPASRVISTSGLMTFTNRTSAQYPSVDCFLFLEDVYVTEFVLLGAESRTFRFYGPGTYELFCISDLQVYQDVFEVVPPENWQLIATPSAVGGSQWFTVRSVPEMVMSCQFLVVIDRVDYHPYGTDNFVGRGFNVQAPPYASTVWVGCKPNLPDDPRFSTYKSAYVQVNGGGGWPLPQYEGQIEASTVVVESVVAGSGADADFDSGSIPSSNPNQINGDVPLPGCSIFHEYGQQIFYVEGEDSYEILRVDDSEIDRLMAQEREGNVTIATASDENATVIFSLLSDGQLQANCQFFNSHDEWKEEIYIWDRNQ